MVEFLVLFGVLRVFVVILFRFETAAEKDTAASRAGPEFEPPARAGAVAGRGPGTAGKDARHARPFRRRRVTKADEGFADGRAPGRGRDRQGLE